MPSLIEADTALRRQTGHGKAMESNHPSRCETAPLGVQRYDYLEV